MLHPERTLVLVAVLAISIGAARADDGDRAAREGGQLKTLQRLEAALRGAGDGRKRQEAALRYRDALKQAVDLEKALPLTEAESELCRVLAAEKSARAGAYRRRVGHHIIVLAPERWFDSAGAGAAESIATLDTAFVLIEDLDGSSFERARHRRLIVIFSPDHPAGGAQTLEGVVFAGLGLLGPPLDDQVLFHEFGHELFAAPNLRPRFETFNEIWPELGRQYVLASLGRTVEFEANRDRYLKAYREKYLAPGLFLESLAPYDVGAGLLQRIIDAALRKKEAYDFEPLRAFFRRMLAVPAQTESFEQRQEILGAFLLKDLGPAVRPVLDEARFHLRDERVRALDDELRATAPLFAELRAKLSRDDLKGALATVDRIDQLRRPGIWRSQAHAAVASFLAGRKENDAALVQLERAGCLVRWRILGPFDNPRGSGMISAFPPERGVDLSAAVDGPKGPLRWQQATGNAITGYVDLAARFAPSDEILAYAFATIESREDAEADLFTGSDDSLIVFVNGQSLASRPFPRGCFVDNDRTRVKLHAGKNEILLKVGNFYSGFGFVCRASTPDGLPLERR
jgi:hypothetical protein